MQPQPGDPPDPGARLRAADGTGVPAVIIHSDATAYPQLRRAISSHIRDVGEFVELWQPDGARRALQMALSIKAEIDGSIGKVM
jgi:hypothetical protein